MELSGNLDERIVSIGTSVGRNFVGSHGNGMITSDGFADISDWPGYSSGKNSQYAGTGFRGGDWNEDSTRLTISDRTYANREMEARIGWWGFRCVRIEQ